MELELGAGLRAQRREGRLNCDMLPGPNIDCVFDLMKPWPFDDNSIDAIHANHVIEHLPDIYFFMQEVHRVTKEPVIPRSTLFLRLPYGPSEAGVGDLTHVTQLTTTSFACFWPGYTEVSNNPQHIEKSTAFAIDWVGLRVNPNLRHWCKPLIRKIGLRIIPYLWNGFVEMTVQAQVLKTPERHAWYKRQPNYHIIPVSYIMWEDEYKGLDPLPERRYIAFQP